MVVDGKEAEVQKTAIDMETEFTYNRACTARFQANPYQTSRHSNCQSADMRQPRTKPWGCLILYIVWPAARNENAPCQSGSKPSLTPCACNPGKLSDTDTGNIVGAPRTASLSGMGG